MPQITLDLTDEAYAKLQERALEGDAGFESQVARALERSLLLSPQESIWVSKRFQTALTSIKGFVSTLLMDEDGTMFEHSDRMEFLDIIDKECDTLRACLQPLPEVIRFRAQPTRLKDVLVEVLDRAIASPRHQPNHKFTLEFGDGIPETFLTDPQALSETLWAFVDEALAYTPQGEEIRIRIGRTENNGLSFSISHHGLGISPKFVRQFNERLNSPTPPERVLGGRSFYSEWLFVQWHGGTFTLEPNSDGRGTTAAFTLRLFDEKLG